MKGITALALIGMAVVITVGGCAQPSPASAPTKAASAPATAVPPVPTKVVVSEPTKAPAAQPTAAPAKVEFPIKGRPISLIVAWAVGGSTDVGARLLAPALQQELGTPVQVVSRPGGGSMTGVTELVRSKPDGYTIGYTLLPTTPSLYLNPDQGATFTRKDFQPVAAVAVGPNVLSVKGDSPYKTTKDFVDAAKAKPGVLTAGVGGILGAVGLMSFQFQQTSGAKLRIVNFQGGNEAVTALLGGHVDSAFSTTTEAIPHAKSGAIRTLGIGDIDENPAFPGVKTLTAQGYKITVVTIQGISGPAGTPKEVVEALGSAMKRVMASEEIKKKFEEAGLQSRYMDAGQLESTWASQDQDLKPLIEQARSSGK